MADESAGVIGLFLLNNSRAHHSGELDAGMNARLCIMKEFYSLLLYVRMLAMELMS